MLGLSCGFSCKSCHTRNISRIVSDNWYLVCRPLIGDVYDARGSVYVLVAFVELRRFWRLFNSTGVSIGAPVVPLGMCSPVLVF